MVGRESCQHLPLISVLACTVSSNNHLSCSQSQSLHQCDAVPIPEFKPGSTQEPLQSIVVLLDMFSVHWVDESCDDMCMMEEEGILSVMWMLIKLTVSPQRSKHIIKSTFLTASPASNSVNNKEQSAGIEQGQLLQLRRRCWYYQQAAAYL